MDKSVLMHADIDKGTKGRNVCDGAFKHHTGFQVLDVIDAVGKGRGFEARTRITARLIKLGDNIAYGWQTETLIDKDARIEAFECCAITHKAAHITTTGGNNLFGNAIGFRVNGGRIKRLGAVCDT
ncbi:hypothetical protein FQZ97_882820 [compost metagenome]